VIIIPSIYVRYTNKMTTNTLSELYQETPLSVTPPLSYIANMNTTLDIFRCHTFKVTSSLKNQQDSWHNDWLCWSGLMDLFQSQLPISFSLLGSCYVILCIWKLDAARAGARGVDSIALFIIVNKKSQSNRYCNCHQYSFCRLLLPENNITRMYSPVWGYLFKV